VTVGAKSRNETAMDGDIIEPNSTGTAVAGVATFLDTEPSHVAQEGSQALASPWLLGEGFAIDPVTHDFTGLDSSRQISSAK
jgi:hypothetical protein